MCVRERDRERETEEERDTEREREREREREWGREAERERGKRIILKKILRRFLKWAGSQTCDRMRRILSSDSKNH